jgi:hypothetical protein
MWAIAAEDARSAIAANAIVVGRPCLDDDALPLEDGC